MESEAICKKVSSMLSLYIDNKVSFNERAFIKEHLDRCPVCRKKYYYLKSLIKNLQDSYKQFIEMSEKKQKQKSFSIREHEKFMNQISPYVDNELEPNESFEFRKYLMKSKNAQKELKNTYIMQKQLRYAFSKTKKNVKPEIAKNVIKEIRMHNNKRNLFESVILQQIFSAHTAKIAILAGLVFIGAYEFKQIDFPLKPKIKQTLEQILDRNIIEKAPVEDYENLEDFSEINR